MPWHCRAARRQPRPRLARPRADRRRNVIRRSPWPLPNHSQAGRGEGEPGLIRPRSRTDQGRIDSIEQLLGPGVPRGGHGQPPRRRTLLSGRRNLTLDVVGISLHCRFRTLGSGRLEQVNCPRCDSSTKTFETRRVPDGAVRRRRECTSCGHRFTTYERAVPESLEVIKRDGSRQPFDREGSVPRWSGPLASGTSIRAGWRRSSSASRPRPGKPGAS